MNKIKIGVICPSEIAFRRFMPALKKSESFEFVGISAATENDWSENGIEKVIPTEKEKAEKFINEYGGKLFEGYKSLISSEEIDAVYLPLPPALHYKWGKLALENGKHVFIEKPFTSAIENTKNLIEVAKIKQLALHENYMFVFHSQLEFIKNLISSGEIGEIRLIRIDFGFPFRGANDFRYNKKLGGGALLDCGGYTLKLASEFLGETAEITASQLNFKQGFEVDIFGSATLKNNDGLTAQVSFGMDNSYRCNLDIWGSTGSIFTNRILTAPDGFQPTIILRKPEGEKSITLEADDTFKKSISEFEKCVRSSEKRQNKYAEILRQGILVDEFLKSS